MRTRLVSAGIVLAALAGATAFACDDYTYEPPAGPTAESNSVAARTLSPLAAVPPDPTNAVADNPKAATLGQMLFFDKSFSGPITAGADDAARGGLGAVGETGKVACASCHVGPVLDDRRSKPGNVSLGTGVGTRHALPLVNASFYAWSNWGGRFDSQWSLALAVAEGAATMNGTRLQIVHAIHAKYKAEYEAIFPALDPRLDPAHPSASAFPPSGKPKDAPWEAMAPADQAIANAIYVNFGKAIAAYLRLLVSRDAPFDKYAAGDKSAISAAADRGLKVFAGKGQCLGCHNGPHFEDGEFHAHCIESSDRGRGKDVPDLLNSPFNTDGGFGDAPSPDKLKGLVASPSQNGQFRTKSLRGIALSGPYMHGGQLATLEDVVAFYNKGGGDPAAASAAADAAIVKDPKLNALGLDAQESADLVEFLKALTGSPVPAALTVDTSKP